jgi:hypothetical protein
MPPCKPNEGYAQMNEKDEDVAHGASYQNQKTLRIRPTSVIRHLQDRCIRATKSNEPVGTIFQLLAVYYRKMATRPSGENICRNGVGRPRLR